MCIRDRSVCYSIIKVGCSACGIGYTEFRLIDNTYFPEYPKSTTYHEDFSEYTKYAPAAFFSLGVGGQWPGHNDHYEADEDAFETGVAFYVQVALDALEKLSK